VQRLIKILIGVACAAVLAGFGKPHLGDSKPSLMVQGEIFVLTQPGKKPLTSRDLVGAVFEMREASGQPVTLRIDSVTPSKEQPSVLLHAFSVHDAVSGKWVPFCDKDAYGRRAGFPVAGNFEGNRFVADRKQWFITCTSGSQGKCILWGYNPWKKGPHGEDLAPYYQACQFMVRANYDGRGESFTKNGTEIDMWDHIGIQFDDPTMKAPFEAGWGLDGAVCVAKTRWADLLTTEQLHKREPRLGVGPCDEKIATAKGALIFNRSRVNVGGTRTHA
jgi:hypothetical protein